MKAHLVYSGPGVYEPHTTSQGVVWQRNTDGDPLFGANVETITSVKKWAELIRVEVPREEPVK